MPNLGIVGHCLDPMLDSLYGHLTDAMLGRAADRTDIMLGKAAASA